MEIIRIGHHHDHDEQFEINRAHGSGDYLLLLVFTPAQLLLNNTHVIMTQPYFILYNINTPQIYGAYHGIYTDDWIHLTLTSRDLLYLNELNIPMDTPVILHDMEELSGLVKALTYEFYATRNLSKDNQKLYLRLLFNRIGEHFYQNNTSPYYPTLNKLRATMYNEPYKKYNIDEMANEVGLSRSAFQHIYKNIFGLGANADLICARTDYAMELLESTQYPVTRIAEMCGYHSDIHFMRQFKEQTKMTPSQYRKSVHTNHLTT